MKKGTKRTKRSEKRKMAGRGEGREGKEEKEEKKREEDMRSISISHVFTLHFKIEKNTKLTATCNSCPYYQYYTTLRGTKMPFKED